LDTGNYKDFAPTELLWSWLVHRLNQRRAKSVFQHFVRAEERNRASERKAVSSGVSLWYSRPRMRQDLEKFILEGARKVTPARLERLIRLLPEIRLVATQVTEFAQLPDQVEFLAQLIEDFYSGLSPEIPYTAIAEAAFALAYLRKGIDIIPDSISGVGYADDAAIINLVFETYKQPFLDHVLARKSREELS
jgi:uncharacterized membrane protein YkvA (DUF1232 family)